MDCRITLIYYAPVAQWIEQWPPEPCVARSTRVRRTEKAAAAAFFIYSEINPTN